MVVRVTRRVHSRGSSSSLLAKPRTSSSDQRCCRAPSLLSFLAVVISAALVYLGYYMNAIFLELRAQRRLRMSMMGISSLDSAVEAGMDTSFANSTDSQLILAAQQDTHQYLSKASGGAEFLILVTQHGEIRVLLRPDLSLESVDYVKAVAASSDSCPSCIIHSAVRTPGTLKPTGLIHGYIANRKNIPFVPTKGSCPTQQTQNEAPLDEQCHGPIMTQGMVAWSTEKNGPFFFINTFDRPAQWWGRAHTVFGQVLLDDTQSWEVISTLFDLPIITKKKPFFRGKQRSSNVKLLKSPIHFSLKLASGLEIDSMSNLLQQLYSNYS